MYVLMATQVLPSRRIYRYSDAFTPLESEQEHHSRREYITNSDYHIKYDVQTYIIPGISGYNVVPPCLLVHTYRK